MQAPETPVAQTTPIAVEESNHCFNTIVEHWVTARIDGPMQAVARYDDASKQLATVGGIIPGLLGIAYSLMPKGTPAAGLPVAIWLFLGSFLLFFVCLAVVCNIQLKMKAPQISALLLSAIRGCVSEVELTSHVHEWCVEIDRILTTKKRWLTFASGFFIFCIILMMYLLLSPFISR